MKKIILLITALLLGISIQAQKKNRNAKHVLMVDGVCKMCKKRIEKACLQTKGVKFANWDIPSHQLMVIMDERKTSPLILAKQIANAGHDTKAFKAPQTAYDNLHHCCKYRGETIRENHKKARSN